MWKRGGLLLVCLVSACGTGGVSEQSFLTALPGRQTVDVSVPAGGASHTGSAALVGETASLYVLTRDTLAHVDMEVGTVIETLNSIARTPPSAVGPDSALWGPFAEALSPVAWRLVVQRLGPDQHTFQLDVRPKAGTDAEFQPFLQGASEGASANGPSQGTFSVELGVAQQLDPVGNPLDGEMVAGWDTRLDRRDIHLHLAAVHAPNEQPSTADVTSAIFGDGSGAIVLDVNANVGVLEVGEVRSRWNATGAGRADAQVDQVDAGSGAEVTECWDSSFGRVYFRVENADGGATEGSLSACVFANPLG